MLEKILAAFRSIFSLFSTSDLSQKQAQNHEVLDAPPKRPQYTGESTPEMGDIQLLLIKIC